MNNENGHNTHPDGCPVMDGEMLGLNHSSATLAVQLGLAEIMVDQGMAIRYASILPLPWTSVIKSFLMPASILAFVPVWVFVSFWWAMGCIALAIWSFRSSRADVARAAAKAALSNPVIFDVLQKGHVVWLRKK